MSILDVLRQRLAARSGIPGMFDVIRPGDPGYPVSEPTPPPSGIPPQYAQSVYDKQNSAYNRLEQLRNTGGGYGNNRFYSQGEIYNYDPTAQSYRGSISGQMLAQPQGPRPPEYEGYINNNMMFPETPASESTSTFNSAPADSSLNSYKQHILYGGNVGGNK